MKTILTLILIAALAFPPAAAADKKAEAYVALHANNALRVLNDKTLSEEARSAKFSETMHTFAYMPGIARRVLGVRGQSISSADFERYYAVFERYATAVYEIRLRDFRGDSLRIAGSSDPAPRRSQVSTLITSASTGKEMPVVWDVLQSSDGETYRVRDVGVNLNGAVIWLAQDQQSQFESFLDRNNGSIDKLIARIESMTSDIASRRRAVDARDRRPT